MERHNKSVHLEFATQCATDTQVESLIGAILEQAVADYKIAYRAKVLGKSYLNDFGIVEVRLRELTDFFTDYCTGKGFSPDRLIRAMQRTVESHVADGKRMLTTRTPKGVSKKDNW